MRRMNNRDVKRNLASALDAAATGTPITITRRGHKPAVIISAEKFECYQAAKQDAEFDAIMGIHGNELRKLVDK